MSLTAGLDIARSALATIASQTDVVSRNIAGANEAGYVHRSAYAVTPEGGGIQLPQITRDENALLFARVVGISAVQTSATAYADGLDRLETIHGDPDLGTSPAAMIEALGDALQLASEAPHDAVLAASAVAQAKELASGLNDASATVQQVRGDADADMASSVARINDLLAQFEEVNTAITTMRSDDPARLDQFDARDRIVSSLSEEIGIRTSLRGNDDMVIYTDSGVTVFETVARNVSFQATKIYDPATAGNAVYVDGVAVTGTDALMPLEGGRLAGLSRLRDDAAVKVQAQLDEVARGLVEAFAEHQQSDPPDLPPRAGLFVDPISGTVPASGTLVTGLAANIAVNANVDPDQGGNVMLLRDGGISDPGSADYTYNQTGAAGYSSRLRELSEGLLQARVFDQTAQLGDQAALGAFAASAAGWLGQARAQAHATSEFQTVLRERSELALSHRTGVNVDEEMTRLLELERSYEASARLISAVDEMFAALFRAV